MGRRKIEDENIRKIQQSKGTYFVSLPINLVRDLKWQERQKVIVDKKGQELVIRDWKEK